MFLLSADFFMFPTSMTGVPHGDMKLSTPDLQHLFLLLEDHKVIWEVMHLFIYNLQWVK